jgi:thioredoxin 1
MKTFSFVLLLCCLFSLGCSNVGRQDDSPHIVFLPSTIYELKSIQEKDFNKEVLDVKGLVIVDVWATWCGPCAKFFPILEQLEKENKEKARFTKIDFDSAETIRRKYSITMVPTLLFFKDGKLVEKSVGVKTKQEVQKIINKHQ